MNIRGKIKISIDLICRNWMLPLLLLLLGFIALYMIDASMSDYFFRRNVIDQCVEPFQEEISRVHYVGHQKLSAEQHEAFLKFQNDFSNLENIDFYGSFTSNNTYLAKQGTDEVEFFETIITDRALIPLSRTGLQENDIELLESYNDNNGLCPVFAGEQIKNQFPVGKEFSLYNTGEVDCVVIGVLPKGAKWIKKGQISTSTSSTIQLDRQLLVCPQNYKSMLIYGEDSSELIYYVCDEENKEQVQSDIVQLAKECNYAITLNDIESMVESEKSTYSLTDNKKFYSAVLLMILSIISMSISELAICTYRKRDYGIMCAFGITIKEINNMMLMENIFIISIAAISAWMIRRLEIIKDFFGIYSIEMEQTAWNISHNQITPLILLICSCIMVLVPSSILNYRFRKEKPSEMIEQKE